jgi:hypothetical protein
VSAATAITNVRVFDGERPGERTTVMIDDGVILASRPTAGIAGERVAAWLRLSRREEAWKTADLVRPGQPCLRRRIHRRQLARRTQLPKDRQQRLPLLPRRGNRRHHLQLPRRPVTTEATAGSHLRGWGQLTLTGSLPRSARAWTGNSTPGEPRSLKHRPEGAIRTVPIPRSSPASSASTCGPSDVPKTGGCSRAPAAARSAKASTAGSGTRPAPQPQPSGRRDRHPAGAPPLRPSPCRAVAVAGLRRPARRDRCPRRAQRAYPAHHLRPMHTRLRPDHQPAHRASPPLSHCPSAGPQEPGLTPGIPVRHTAVPQPDSTGHSWT